MYFIISSVGGGQQKNVVSIGRGCCCDEGTMPTKTTQINRYNVKCSFTEAFADLFFLHMPVLNTYKSAHGTVMYFLSNTFQSS